MLIPTNKVHCLFMEVEKGHLLDVVEYDQKLQIVLEVI